MKLDKNALSKLTILPDDALWKIICALGTSKGIDLSSVSLDKSKLDTVRSVLTHMTDEDISRATEILSQAKKGDNTNGK